MTNEADTVKVLDAARGLILAAGWLVPDPDRFTLTNKERRAYDACCELRDAIAAWNHRLPHEAEGKTGLVESELHETAVAALRQLKRTLEMQANIMCDGRRTGGWEGAERVANAFDSAAARLGTIILTQEPALSASPSSLPDPGVAGVEVTEISLLADAFSDAEAVTVHSGDREPGYRLSDRGKAWVAEGLLALASLKGGQ